MLSEVLKFMAENRNRPGETDESGFGENYISLTDEDGVETEFKIVDSIDLDEGSYVALEPTPDDPVAYLNSDGSLVILKVVEEDGEEILATIDDDDEYDEIADILREKLKSLSSKEAIKETAKENDIPKNVVYDIYLKNFKD